jgi:hypothetical protein
MIKSKMITSKSTSNRSKPMASSTKHLHPNARPAEHQQSAESRRKTGLNPATDVVEYFREYAREKPEVVALWCLGIGFVLGWKLKPW